jgi:CheY-like chemotaxis protein
MAANAGNGQPAALNNTVRLREADLAALNRELDAASGGGDFKRRTVRWDFLKGSVRIEMSQPGGAMTNLRYAARNLSSDGVGILHSSYVHAGTACNVYLPQPDGTEAAIPSTVMRCKHFKGLIHEVGIKFKRTINIREFLNVDPLEGRFTLEYVDPARLQGALLYVDDSPMDRRLVRHFLKDTTLNVIAVENCAEALARVKEHFDVVLLDNDLADGQGTQLADQLRNAGVNQPIIMVTADKRASLKEAARAARINAIVCKPINQEKLLQAIGEFLLLDGSANEGAGALYTTLKAEDPTYQFVAEYIEELRTFISKLQQSIQADDFQGVRRQCFQIRGAAPTLGFVPVGDAAEAAMVMLDATGSVNESAKPLRHLIGTCMRVKVRDDAKKAA